MLSSRGGLRQDCGLRPVRGNTGVNPEPGCRGQRGAAPAAGAPAPASSTPQSAALAPVLTSFPFWLLLSGGHGEGGSGKGGRAREPGGVQEGGIAEKPGRGREERPGTRAQPRTLPEQVRAGHGRPCRSALASDPLTRSAHGGRGFPAAAPLPQPPRGTPTGSLLARLPHARLTPPQSHPSLPRRPHGPTPLILLSAMLPRPLRLLLDTNPPGGVVLSGFRSRDPEEGGDAGGRAVGGGQEDEDEEEEEVRRGGGRP